MYNAFNFGAGSLLTGGCTAAYGCYKYLQAGKILKPGKRDKEKIAALKILAAATATVALGIGLIGISYYYSNSNIVQRSTDVGGYPSMKGTQAEKVIPAEPTANELLAGLPSENENTVPLIRRECPIPKLKTILAKEGNDSIIAKTFKVFEDTQGISCQNFISPEEYYVKLKDGIPPEYLKKTAMWGIDERSNPFIAFKYLCNYRDERSMTLSLENDGEIYLLDPASILEREELKCDKWILHSMGDDYLKNLSKLLGEGSLVHRCFHESFFDRLFGFTCEISLPN